MVHARSRPSLRALIGIYSRLLDRIVASDYDVLAQRIRVPTWQKSLDFIALALGLKQPETYLNTHRSPAMGPFSVPSI